MAFMTFMAFTTFIVAFIAAFFMGRAIAPEAQDNKGLSDRGNVET